MVMVHVVIVGCGRVGTRLALRLGEQGHTVAVIDKQARAFRRLPPEWPGTAVVGSGFDRDALERAGAAGAGALAAVTSGDNSNILTARIARENYGIPNVVARIYDPRRAEIYQRLGIPTVATVTWTTDQVLRRLLPDTVLGEWTDSSGQLVLVERLLPEAWAGKALGELGLRNTVTVVAVVRGGVPRLDVSGLVGQEGDVLHLAVLKDDVAELERRFDGLRHSGRAGPAAPGAASGSAP
ncbi:MAG: TrkA family potassium uptake protein [Acidimicrobiales bacterium]|jgi:trk system potassium uptake protein TrkA